MELVVLMITTATTTATATRAATTAATTATAVATATGVGSVGMINREAEKRSGGREPSSWF